MDVGVSLFHFVEQDYRIRAFAHRFGQNPALAIADIAGRRAFQGRHRVRLLEFAHVDDDHGIVARIEHFGQNVRRLGLADARGTTQHEHADRLARIIQLGAAGFDPLGDFVHGVILTDHAGLQLGLNGQDGSDLVLHHPADRNAGPVADDGGDGVGVHDPEHHRLIALRGAKGGDGGAQGRAMRRLVNGLA